jgi:PPM family protein phosphatase
VSTCPGCAAPAEPADRFCGSCGASLADIRRVAVPRPPDDGASACADCGNTTFTDGYCSACGHRRPTPDRDSAELAPLVLITDRGIEHHRNEDAGAAAVLAGDTPAYAVVVSDGVSSSEDAQLASLAAATAGVEAMMSALAAAPDLRAAVLAGLTQATKAAAACARAGSSAATAPSCTYTGAVVQPAGDGTALLGIGNAGDSRAYWLSENLSESRQLTVDDSLAQELMSTGLPADSPAVLRGAHTITRWLGADSEPQPWADAAVQVLRVTGPGTLLLCSDGLWNYLPDAEELARYCSATEPMSAAQSLVDFALAAGGQDNITVALIPIGGPP